MKIKTLQIIGVLVLALFVGYLILDNTSGSIDKKVRNFAVADTASVNKFYFSDKHNNLILLERKQKYWTVNGGNKVSQAKINSLLKVLNRIRVKEPVAKVFCKDVLNDIDIKSIKVEVYSEDELIKAFYVGEPTKNLKGTYMIMASSEQPFVVELSGFRGYLASNFSPIESDWDNNTVFNVIIDNIKQVWVENLINTKESFKIVYSDRDIEFYNYSNIKVERFDTTKVVDFLLEFENKIFDNKADDISLLSRDSILMGSPIYIVLVEDVRGQKQRVEIYSKPVNEKFDFFGNEIKSDPNIFLMMLESNDLVYAQYLNYNSIFKNATDFK